MSFEEKSTWIAGFTQLAVGLWYALQIIGKAATTPISDITYGGELATMIVASVVLTVAITIVVAATAGARAALGGDPIDIDRSDERDRTIGRFAGNIGGVVLAVGMVPALGFAVFEFDHFWIAHSILSAMFLSVLVTDIVKLFAYRRGI
jgi:hypothetical protein